MLEKKYHDPLNNADAWHDEPHCQAKGGARRILQQKDSMKTENKGQSICHQFWYNQAAEKMQGKLNLQRWRRILFDEGFHIHFFPSVLSSLIKMLSLPTAVVSEKALCEREVHA